MFPSWFIEWSSFFLLLEISGTIYEPCPVCWDSPGDIPAVLTATSGVSSAFLSTLIPEASRLGMRPGPVPRDDEQGLGLDAFWPIMEWLHPLLTLAMSQSVNCPLAKECKFRNCLWCQDRLPETLVREATDTRGACELGWGLRWFRRLVL